MTLWAGRHAGSIDRPALHRPCRPQGGVLTLTDPRGEQFFKLTDRNPIVRPTGLMYCLPTPRLCVYSLYTMTTKRCSQANITIVKRFLSEHFLNSVENGPQNGVNSGKWGSKYYILCSRPRKDTSLCRSACFSVFCVKIRPGDRPNTFWCAKSRMHARN